MVDWKIEGGTLQLRVRGMDRLWALESALTIPLMHVAGVQVNPAIAHEWWHGLKVMGSDLPHVLTAGEFRQHGKKIFWDVHHLDRTIAIGLHDEQFDELVVEVEEPEAAAEAILAEIRSGRKCIPPEK